MPDTLKLPTKAQRAAGLPKTKSNVSTKVQVKSGTPSKAPTRTSKAINKPSRSIPTKPQPKPAPKPSGGQRTAYITLLDMIHGTKRSS